jgi:hypothetical protein
MRAVGSSAQGEEHKNTTQKKVKEVKKGKEGRPPQCKGQVHPSTPRQIEPFWEGQNNK